MDLYSPRQPSQVLRHPDILSPALPTPASQGHEELPPIQMASPKSESNGHTPILSLPPIRAHLGAQLEQPNFNEKELTLRHGFPHSPPAAAVPRMGMPGGHSSPPISPHNIYQSMPSPAQSMHMHSPYGNYYKNGPSSRSIDHSSVSSHTETPNTDLGTVSTPATSTSITDRMSIDNMTNPPTATFVCTFQGCNAPAFQTQYLLNSHANVHSSARPHYCPVKGCPRAEGGKGFKRKNEMIRHGLVHDSPGYVCPFCPDREHKYPRPDNLQRHVRVHHIDKDKDDPQLRDVLSQRPDGPNRGRRRRGAP
ncbi:hypothetical protein BX600DRAFT_80398 [Xylariales sp. PMI_506]|nr:hypothetical protein BX600DRAFT_80398 [Xylariales sp. PMI_506]